MQQGSRRGGIKTRNKTGNSDLSSVQEDSVQVNAKNKWILILENSTFRLPEQKLVCTMITQKESYLQHGRWSVSLLCLRGDANDKWPLLKLYKSWPDSTKAELDLVRCLIRLLPSFFLCFFLLPSFLLLTLCLPPAIIITTTTTIRKDCQNATSPSFDFGNLIRFVGGKNGKKQLCFDLLLLIFKFTISASLV